MKQNINFQLTISLKHFNDSKAFIEYSNNMVDIFKNMIIEDYSPNKKRKILIIFDDVIVTELFIRDRKLNISLVFITQSYFVVPNNIRLNPKHYFIMEIPNKQELKNCIP